MKHQRVQLTSVSVVSASPSSSVAAMVTTVIAITAVMTPSTTMASVTTLMSPSTAASAVVTTTLIPTTVLQFRVFCDWSCLEVDDSSIGQSDHSHSDDEGGEDEFVHVD